MLTGDRIDFAALQRRITVGVDPAHPAYLIAFDVLQHSDHGVILSETLSVRRDLLAGLLADASPAIALCPQSTDIAVAVEHEAPVVLVLIEAQPDDLAGGT